MGIYGKWVERVLAGIQTRLTYSIFRPDNRYTTITIIPNFTGNKTR